MALFVIVWAMKDSNTACSQLEFLLFLDYFTQKKCLAVAWTGWTVDCYHRWSIWGKYHYQSFPALFRLRRRSANHYTN